MNTMRLPILAAALRGWSADQETRRVGDDDAVAEAATVTLLSLARMRKRCRILNDAYEAAENKPEVRVSIQKTVGNLRELHARLPSRLREKSWILTIEYYDGWILDARKSA